MVTQHHPINPILNRQPHILHRLHAFQNNRHRTLPPNPLQILPAQCFVDVLSHQPPQTTALVILAALRPAHLGLDLDSLRRSLVGFALARDGSVDGDEDGFDAEGFGSAEEFNRLLAVGVDVELEEEGVVWGGGGDDGWEGEGGVT